jgi:hypothetical protein
MAYFYWTILEYLLIAAGALQSRALISQESPGTTLFRLRDQTVRPGTASIQSPLARLACSFRQGELHNTFTSLISAPIQAAWPTGTGAGAGATRACSRTFGQSIKRSCPLMSSTSEVQLSTQSPSLQ